MMQSKAVKASLFLVAMSTAGTASAVGPSSCDAGYFDVAGGSSCVPALPGTYVPNSGATAATPARAGHYVDIEGATEDTPLSPGYYVASTGSSRGDRPEPGYYVPDFGATEPTLASPGSYVPSSGASRVNIASPGYYVSDFGATAQTAAPAGTFVAMEGAASPVPAPVGYYVPTTGASAPKAVSPGFFSVTTGAINQLPFGGAAVPVTAALQSERFLTSLAMDLMDDEPSKDRLKAAFAYQYGQVKQDGITAGKLKSNIYGFTVQADLWNHPVKKLGMVVGYSHQTLKNTSEINAKGDTYQLGVFHTMPLGKLNLLGMLMYGATKTDNTRNITASYYSGGAINNLETLKSTPSIRWYGLQTKANYPWEYSGHHFINFAEIGVLSFRMDHVSETGTATANGASVQPLALINAASFQYTSIPITLGVSYDILNASAEQKIAPLSLSLGASKDMTGRKKLHVTPQADPSQSFALPIAQTSQTVGILKLTAVSMNLVKNMTLSGVLQAQAGSKFMAYEAYVKASLDW